MIEKLSLDGELTTGQKYNLAPIKAECVRQMAAGARHSAVAQVRGISPALLGRWQHQVLEAAEPSSAERDKIKPLRTALKRGEMECEMLKKS